VCGWTCCRTTRFARSNFYFTSPQPIEPKEASDSDFTIEDVMLWPGMRFLRSQCKRCSAGRLQNFAKENFRKKTFNFSFCIEVQQSFSFPFILLRHYQIPESFDVTNCCFSAGVTVLPCYRTWYSRSVLALISLSRQNKDIIVVDKVNYHGTQS